MMLGFVRLSGAALIDIKRRPTSQIRDRRRVWAAAVALISSAGALAVSYFVFGRHGDSGSTSCLLGGRSAGISDGNRDGNDGSRQRPDAAVNSHLLPAHPA